MASAPLGNHLFILDTLHDAAKILIRAGQGSSQNYYGYNFDAMEILLSRDDVASSEFELVKLTHRWCRRNNAALIDFLPFFDVNLLTAEEKAWTLNQLPPALELLHRKLIVVRVDERLTLAIYVPQKIERCQECQVDDRVRLFAFPHSQSDETSHRLALPTKVNYRLYCDGNVFQLFERARSNSWIYIARGGSDDSSYRSQETAGDRRRGQQATIHSGVNFDCRASVALDKFSTGLQKHVGRVNRNRLLGAEIYVISNRDVKSMQNLDLWLEFIDTREVMPLFENNAKEYSIPKLSNANWSQEPEYIVKIAKGNDLSTFDSLSSGKQFHHVFGWLLERGESGLLFQCFRYLLAQLQKDETNSARTLIVADTMLNFLKDAPSLSATFAQMGPWASLPPDMNRLLGRAGSKILQAHIISANQMQQFVTDPFKRVLSQVQSISLTEFAGLVEFISLTVRSADVALDILLECLEPESTRIFPGNLALVRHFVRNLLGIALDHIDETSQPQIPRKDLLSLKLGAVNSEGDPVVECQIRIDAPIGTLATGDHVRLTTTSRPANSTTIELYSMDALVESSQPGAASFRCFHPTPPFLERCSWELQNCGSFVSTKTMFDAVHTIATQRASCGISDYILGTQERTSNDYSPLLSGYTIQGNLNSSQNAAVEASLSYPFTCLWGPPGTGKTYTLVEINKQLQTSNKHRRILVTEPTHNAVDNVMRKYLANTISGELLEAAEPIVLRVSTDVRKVAEDLKKYTCDAMAGKEIYTSYSALNKARDQIKRCHLIFTTCIGAGLGLLRSESFDTVIIDEASQQTEPASLVPLVKGCQKAILVGDHVQLGATVQKHAVLQQFDISLFERLYKQQESSNGYRKAACRPGYNLVYKTMLDTQYRMHESVCKFSSDEFYESRLHSCVPNDARPLFRSEFPLPSIISSGKRHNGPSESKARMLFVECSAPEDLGRKSKSNEGQAKIWYEVCRMLCTKEANNITQPIQLAIGTTKQQLIAVLTPYSRQAELLRGRLSQFSDVEVSSIDGFQGREADIVVLVTVRCNVHHEFGFLKDLRRMNVALTQARAAVIVIGHRATLTMGTADPEATAAWRRLLSVLTEIKIEYQKV